MVPTQHTINTNYPVGPVHCYSAEISGELVLFDTGPPTNEAKQFLQQHLDLHRLRYVLLTHCHIDHYGLAAWLESEYGCTIYLPYRDSLKIARHSERLDGMAAVLGEIGFDHQFMEAFRTDLDSDSVFPKFPQQHKVVEQEMPEELGVEFLNCPGHSQSDLVYVGADWAITGDTMLREIFQSPLLDIDLLSGQRFRNYDAYCDTIVKLATLRGKQILPGHRGYIHGVDYNICFYTGKFLDRARLSRQFSLEMTAPQVVETLFGKTIKEPFQIYLKASEIVFIRDFLAEPTRLKTALEQIGLFPQLAEAFELATGGTDGSSGRQ
jgi:2,4-dienoyl-CoA reductase (NADPH2)